MKLNYRADIDGLRAIAVLSVILNHAGISLFAGGFIGVDVFFVISGYLITTIIMREIDANEFSLAKFYERRIRRIYPALFTVLLFIIIASAILYDAHNFESFGKSLIATTFFSSNIYFWTETGYFEAPAQIKPLLHTWSLAVEEQYYIVFPLLMAFLARYFKPRIRHILAGMALLSFVWDIYALQNDPSGAFYFAHLRAWELLIGSVLALSPFPTKINSSIRNSLSLIGLGMIAAPIFLYTENTAFPGFAAAAPALGTALIIYSGIEDFTFVNKLLSISPLVFIGKISYSLYLWHWPLIIFGKYYAIKQLTSLETGGLLAATFLMATLAWQFIEKPFRSKNLSSSSSIFRYAGAIMAITAGIGALIYFSGGLPILQKQGVTYEIDLHYTECNFTSDAKSLTFCSIGIKAKTPSFLLWGDSHASALAKGAKLSAFRNKVAGQLTYATSCPPLLDMTPNKREGCIKFNNMTMKYIEDHPEIGTIFLAGRWTVYTEGTGYKENKKFKLTDTTSRPSANKTNEVLFADGLERTVQKLLALNRKVIIISQVPEIKYDVPSAYFIAQRTGRDINNLIAPSLEDYLSRNKKAFLTINMIRKNDNIQVIDPWKVLCNEQQCFVVIDKTPLYVDADHLSTFGSNYISHIFDPIFKELASH